MNENLNGKNEKNNKGLNLKKNTDKIQIRKVAQSKIQDLIQKDKQRYYE